jgi:hypothetical protein
MRAREVEPKFWDIEKGYESNEIKSYPLRAFDIGKSGGFNFYVKIHESTLENMDTTRSAQNRLATIRLPNAGPTTGLKSANSRLYECRLLADFRPAVGPAFGSRMVAKRFCADRAVAD